MTDPDTERVGQACITCGDVAVPVRVRRLCAGALALVESPARPGALEEISVALVAAAVGDVVLAHAGEAIAVLHQADEQPDTGGAVR